MTEQLVVVGAGGFGREALDVLAELNRSSPHPVFDLLGVLDDQPSAQNLARLAARDVVWLGTVRSWLDRPADARFVVAIGTPSVRRKVVEELVAAGRRPATLVHPRAMIGSAVHIGDGSVVCGGVHISTNVQVGAHAHLNPNATIGHDTTLGDYVSVNPAATVSGDVVVGDGVLVGAGAVVLQGLTLGADSVVGASACVVDDVAASSTVKGVPARSHLPNG